MIPTGERVLAEWPHEKEWGYPGTVVSQDGALHEVQFDDGDRALLEERQVRPLAMKDGDRVQCRWKGGTAYYPGVLKSVSGAAFQIDYDDGDRERSAVSMIRVNVGDLR